jgi:predicted nucleotidyltransferase
MKFDSKKAHKWLIDTSTVLPEIDSVLQLAASQILVIGAGVFDIYHIQNWTPALRRKTGDLDLSVGILSGEDDYRILTEALKKNGYKNSYPQYRFFPPKIVPGALAYIDLLAHPISNEVTDNHARQIMGVGPDFSLAGMRFASLHSYPITAKISCPNPIAMAALKMISYRDDPINRIKDLADIGELGWGIVQTGTHFEMRDLWQLLSTEKESLMVKKVLLELGKKDSSEWDLEEARQELLGRNFSAEDIEETIPQRLKEWSNYLE